MAKRRSEMTEDELEAARARDREVWERRKQDPEYMARKRSYDKQYRREWYKDEANAESHRIEMRERWRLIRKTQPERHAALLAIERKRAKERYWRDR